MNDSLNNTIQELKTAADGNDIIQSIDSKVQSISEQNAQTRSKAEELRASLQERLKEYGSLLAATDSLREEAQRLKDAVNLSKKELESLHQSKEIALAQASGEQKQLETSNRELQTQIVDLRNQVSELTRDHAASVEQLNQTQIRLRDSETLASQVPGLREELNLLRDTADQANITRLENVRLREEISSLETNVAKLTQSLESSVGKHASSEEGLKLLRDEKDRIIAELKSQVERLSVENQNLSDNVDQKQAELTVVRRELEKERENVQALREQIDTLSNEKVNETTRLMQETKAKVSEMDQQILTKEKEKDDLAQKTFEYMTRMTNTEIQNRKLLEDHNQANIYLKTAITGLKKIRNNLDNLIEKNVGGIAGIFKEMKESLEDSHGKMQEGGKKLQETLDSLLPEEVLDQVRSGTKTRAK